MSNINIENLSYDMNMDREAMDAISGAWGYSSIKRWAKKALSYVQRNPGKVRKAIKWIRRWF